MKIENRQQNGAPTAMTPRFRVKQPTPRASPATGMNDPFAIVVLMTAGSPEEATRLAEHLVDARLAACVQMITGMESVYRWEGKIERSSETLILAKTTQEKFNELEAVVRSLHNYTTPEIIALPVTVGSAPYLEWLTKNIGD